MPSNNSLRLIFSLFLLCSLSCSSKSDVGHSKFRIALLDSANHSSRAVSMLMHLTENGLVGYVAGEQNTLELYGIDEKGKLDFMKQYPITDRFGGLRALTSHKLARYEVLILGNKANNSLEVHQMGSNGELRKLSSVNDTDTTFIDETVTIQKVTIGSRTFIYAGGLDKGLSCYELSENGVLHPVQSIADDKTQHLHGIIGMSTLSIGDKQFLFTGAFFDNGISCYQVMQNGHLQNISNIKDDSTLFLNGTFPVNAVQFGNENYLLVGHRHQLHYAMDNAEKHYHGDGINVFRVSGQGQMRLHSQLKDDNKLLLKGATRIEIIKTNEKQALVFIATRDDKGIQVCSLGADGILRPIKSIDLGYSIYNGMTLKNNKDNWYLWVGAYDRDVVEVYSIAYN